MFLHVNNFFRLFWTFFAIFAPHPVKRLKISILSYLCLYLELLLCYNSPMRKPTKIGKIIITSMAQVHPHELVIARILTLTGYDVIFRPCHRLRSADIIYRSIIWEIKSPTGSSSRTLENNLRCALRQSENIIIDLHRTNISETSCLRYLRNHISTLHGLKRLMIITKDDRILHISPKTGRQI